MKKQFLLLLSGIALLSCTNAQPLHQKTGFTRQDSLRGTVGPERAWWNVLHYAVSVTPDYTAKSITGKTIIRYQVLPGQTTDYMQIDLQQPLKIDTLFYDGKMYINYPGKPYYNEGNVWHVPLPRAAPNSIHTIGIAYHGTPRAAVTPPWDGGWVFTRDEQQRAWMSVACQGLGASVWYPCKDHQSDEPDSGATLTMRVPDSLVAIGNGRLQSRTASAGMSTYTWAVQSPINNYTIIPYIGKYVRWSDTLMGEKGPLHLNYAVLDYNRAAAEAQFKQVKPMLRAFEYWFGPYPFYEDGYQLVEAPYLGMEHQSAVAYGNGFANGYQTRDKQHIDLSGTGWGMKWDYIIVHESGHEWFANNITTKDIADMWVHEGFTDYSEALFIEYYFGKQAADTYVQGLRRNIQNEQTIIGPYGVNREGSGDMYYKGANMLHTIRQVINDDEKFRQVLRGLNKDFYHQTVTTQQVENYISTHSGVNLAKVFDQYLRTVQVPQLELKQQGNQLSYRWTNCVPGFDMPVRLSNGQWLRATTTVQKIASDPKAFATLAADPNFYVTVAKQ